MAKKPASADRFTVTYNAPFEAENAAAGVVAVDAAHRLSVVSAEPAYAAKLDLAASMLNSGEAFLLNALPPEGTATRAQFRRVVARDAAEARAALLEILRDKYGFTLTPA